MSRLRAVARALPRRMDPAGAGGRRERRPGARAGVLAAAGGVLGLSLPTGAGADWSPPALLTGCPIARAPVVVFPASDPHTRSGPGAILWTGDPTGCAGARPGIGLAPIGPADVPGRAQSVPRAAGPPPALAGLVAARGTGDGRILIAAGLARARAGVIEGRAGAAFSRPVGLPAATAPLGTATSYLGDVALATVNARTGRVELRIQRRGAPGLSRPTVLSTRPEPVSALAVGLDYRGDALVGWAQGGWIYRRVRYVAGNLDTIERIAASPLGTRLQVLISDDNRGIAAWTTTTAAGAGAGAISRVYLATSRPGVHFGRPRLLEQVRDLPGLRRPDGSLQLVRLASEGVMMAWTGMTGGRYVVRAASVSQFAVRPPATISDPSTDAILADLAPGPRGEALALWVTAPRRAGGLDPAREQILAARGVAEPPGLAVFSAPEPVGRPGAIAGPRAAIDPGTGRAIAVWQEPGPGRGIVYAERTPPPPPGAAGRGHGRPGGGGVSALLVGLGGLAALAGLGASRRVRRRTLALAQGRADRPTPLR